MGVIMREPKMEQSNEEPVVMLPSTAIRRQKPTRPTAANVQFCTVWLHGKTIGNGAQAKLVRQQTRHCNGSALVILNLMS